MKRHDDHCNTYETKHLIGLAYSLIGLIQDHQGRTCQCHGRYGAEKGVETCTSWAIGSRGGCVPHCE